MKNSMWVLDLSWLCNLFYFAGNSKKKIENGEEDKTSALRGFILTVCKILKQNPTYLVVAVDSPLSFRKELEPTYKSTRREKDEGYIESLIQIKECIDLLGIPRIEVGGYEGDDIMASLAEEGKKLELPTVIVSKDKDMRQCLVQGKVGMYNKQKDGWKFFSQKDAEEDWGIKIHQCCCSQTLTGDLCDSIRGARGIGQKRASQLLKEYDTIDGIYENLSKLSEPFRKSLEELQPRLDTVRKLVTLVKNVGNICPVLDDFGVADFKLDLAGLNKLLKRNDLMQLESLIKDTYGAW